jgi:hypothetical protein
MLEKDGWVIRSEDKDSAQSTENCLYGCGCGCLVGLLAGILSGFFMYGFWEAVFDLVGLI